MEAHEQYEPENLRDDQAEDFDLLTFGEARARLAEEIDAEQARLAALLADGSAGPAGVAASRARLEALGAALRRNRAGRITADTAADFFGHTR